MNYRLALLIVLLSPLVVADFLEEGTIFEGTTINMTATISQNLTVENAFSFDDGFGFDYSNISMSHEPETFINITDLFYSSNESAFVNGTYVSFTTTYYMNATGNDTYVNFTYNGDYLGTININIDGVTKYSSHDQNFSINLTETTKEITIIHSYTDLDICTGATGEFVAINFTLLDEYNQTELFGDISVDLQYGTNVLSFQNHDVSSLALCLSGFQNYTVNGAVYSDVSYLHKYFLINDVLSNDTQKVNIYNYLNSGGISTLEYLLKDFAYRNYIGIYGYMQRYYPANHSWQTVQHDRSDDFGRLVYHIEEENVEYRFLFYDSGESLISSTDSIKFVCTSGLCQTTSQIIINDTSDIDIGFNYVYDNATDIIYMSWNDGTGKTKSVNITVAKETMTGRMIICNHTSFSYAGTYNCNASGYTGRLNLIVRSSASPEVIKENAYIDIIGDLLHKNLSQKDSNLWAFAISLVLVGAGISGSPVAVIIMMLFGMLMMSLIGISGLFTTTFMAAATIVGIVIALTVKR